MWGRILWNFPPLAYLLAGWFPVWNALFSKSRDALFLKTMSLFGYFLEYLHIYGYNSDCLSVELYSSGPDVLSGCVGPVPGVIVSCWTQQEAAITEKLR